MVRIGEEVFPNNSVHPPCTLLTKWIISRELTKHLSEIAIPYVPDLVPELLERLVPGLLVLCIASEKLRVSILEVLGIHTREICNPRPVVWIRGWHESLVTTLEL
jgi:hypothetical protein